MLREDPRSVFSRDVQIENTEGPLDYDLSRIYTGTVEGKHASIGGLSVLMGRAVTLSSKINAQHSCDFR